MAAWVALSGLAMGCNSTPDSTDSPVGAGGTPQAEAGTPQADAAGPETGIESGTDTGTQPGADAAGDGSDAAPVDLCLDVCTRGCTIGDPHVTTLDEVYFDHQAAGEFVLAKDGELEVQIRQQRGFKCSYAMWNSAVAFKTTTTKVSVHADEQSFVRLGDGRTFPMGPLDLTVDNLHLTFECGKLFVRYASGDVVTVGLNGDVNSEDAGQAYTTRALDVQVVPIDSHKGKMSGIFGNYDGDRANDVPGAAPAWDAFYTFLKSHQVAPASSLFVYATGDGPSSYPFETPGPMDISKQPAEDQTKAQAACGAITDATLKKGCILDVVCGDMSPETAAAWFTSAAPRKQVVEATPATSCAAGKTLVTGMCVDNASVGGALRVELPCEPHDVSDGVCNTLYQTTERTITIGGTSAEKYDLTIRVRGVVEPKDYADGTADGFFYTGGTPSGDSMNVFELDVSAPATTYYLNYGGDSAYGLDYQQVIRVQGGATIRLSADSIDNAIYTNTDSVVVAGIAPAPSAFDGQFVQIDVISATLVP
jgi:hypothetical protein